MGQEQDLGEMVPYTITRYRNHSLNGEETRVAAEVPLTFEVNGQEIATLMCTPSHLNAYAHGFLFTSGLIKSAGDILSIDLDRVKWRMRIRVNEPMDPDLLAKRVYTSGCGKGVMYTSVTELSGRHPIKTRVQVRGQDIIKVMTWLQKCSDLHQTTGGVHSAAVSVKGRLPEFHIDDIGRHNAVDKIIGTLLMDKTDCSSLVLATTGRISSEIIHKARRMNIPILASRGAPTHQSVLLAKEMGMTIAGFVRRTNFAIFTHAGRITAP